ncbi:MAG: phosphoglycolate phosphatase [Rhodospirillaceae bacterium]|nr:phosphoglycolate phosphatase [Rhodospirillaceae bacterium]
MSGFSAGLFDLDGTIIDSAPDVCASVNRVLQTMNRPSISVTDTKELVGFGARTLVEKALQKTGAPGSEDEIDYLLSGFLDSYRQNPSEHSIIFPGAREALERLIAAGMTLGICTNKPEATCFPVLEAFDLKRYFPTVICGDTLEFRKPDPRHVFHTLHEMGAQGDDAVFIGDSEADIEAANKAELPSILVTFGYCHVPFDSLGANAVIDHFDDLDEALELIDEQRNVT